MVDMLCMPSPIRKRVVFDMLPYLLPPGNSWINACDRRAPVASYEGKWLSKRVKRSCLRRPLLPLCDCGSKRCLLETSAAQSRAGSPETPVLLIECIRS